MNLLKKAVWGILRVIGIAELVSLSKGALREYGWVRSSRTNASVDATGEPLPWITYPAIHLLQTRVTKELRVFEFGCGNSTLWWAKRVASVHSVEHDKAWFDVLAKLVPENVSLTFVPLERGGAYSKACQPNGIYDIIVVDGRDRVNCIKNSLAALSDTGIAILDNSDREEYREGIDFLQSHGFKRLPLRGLAPIVTFVSETSIFYRADNVLGF